MKVTTSTQPTFLAGLTLLFIGCKLTGYIKWSWLWVLSPIWISALIVLLCHAIIKWIDWKTRPRTPEEKLRASLQKMAKALEDRR